MRYRVLGTTRALTDDGTPVALGGARLRALLTSLALRPGRAVPVAALLDDVWDGDRPADAVAALQALVGRLRRALGHDAVASAEGGYLLAAAPDDVDLHRFGRLAAEGARALDAGDPADAEALLTEALGLWTGPALADLPDGSREAARWEARRRDARRARLTAALALGKAEQSLPELVDLCEDFPLDEPLWALHIQALADASRPAEALETYDRVRRLLADRLGTDPGPELRGLHARLLEAGPEPGRPPAGSGLPAALPPQPAGAPTAPAGNLRARLTSFVGREEDMATIRDDLGQARLVTLLGPGGSGKTRLSQEAAEAATARLPDTWPDGVWLAELAPVSDPAAVPEAVLSALGARETVLRGAGAEGLRAADPHANEPLARLAERCGRRGMLLILDNCEHLVGAAAALAEHLLAHCPRLTVLATSREPLGVPGELLRPVEPLPPEPALRLFAERGRAARAGFDPDTDPAAAAEICRRLDGLPLGIELAAARLRMLSPRQIADRLDDRFRLLTSGSRTVLPRQQTLRAVVDWSWDLLDGDERAVLARLSVFAGGCDLAGAEAVCAVGGAPDVMAALGSLVDKSLVVAAPTPRGDMRYRLLETVNEYAGERLDASGEREGTERRHLVHYRELARTTDPLLRGAGQAGALALLQGEYENIRAALRRAVAAADEQEALCLVLSLGWYWHLRDLRADTRLWAAAAVGLGPDPFAEPTKPAPPIVARCTDAPPPMPQELLEEARREVGLMRMVTIDQGRGGDAPWGDPESLEWMRRVAAVYRPGLPQTCRFPAMYWFFTLIMTGEAERLMDALNATVGTCEELGLDWELASALQIRANLLANRTAWTGDAKRDADRAMEIYTRLGDSWGTAEALSARGEAREKQGDHAGAVEDFAAAIGHAELLEATSQVTVLRARLAINLMETGAGDEGEKILREILGQYRGPGEPLPSAHEAVPAARLYLTTWLGRTGRVPEAREQLVEVRQAFASAPIALFEGFADGIAAWLDAAEGRYADARVLALGALESAMSPMIRMIAPEMPAVHLLTLAWATAGAAGAPAPAPAARVHDAARLIGAYRALLPDGHHPAPLEQDILRAACDATLAALGGDTAVFDAACARGAALTLEQAAEVAAG